MSTADQLEKLANLLREGLITREQFDQERDALLSGGRNSGQSGRTSSIGSYQITGDIGQGGMGRVYRGRHRTAEFAERQGGDVAIKVLHAQYAERAEIVERFEREAALGIKLDHPGIVRVHELTVDADRVALVMELVEGRPLSEMIGTETGPIPWTRAQPMVAELLDAIRYAHGQGVVHRDLKPENIMVSPEGRLKILDFGIAKDMSAGRTKTGTGMGTVDYMAPEQYIDAKAVDARADIYALGMTIYEMLAGRLPWGEEASEFSILEAKKNGQIPPPTNFYPDIPEEVVAVVMRMLRPDMEVRYGDATEVEVALKAVEAVLRAETARIKAKKAGAAMPAVVPHVATVPITKRKAPLLAILGLIAVGVVWILFVSFDSEFDIEEGIHLPGFLNIHTDVTDTVRLELAYIPPGTFPMALAPDDAFGTEREAPLSVTLTQGFWMGTTEVTQELYEAVMGDNPSENYPTGIICEDCPVENMTMFDVASFCNALSELQGLSPAYTIDDTNVTQVVGASGYRLPTEAEWEYAARAGEYHTYAGSDQIDAVAWYAETDLRSTQEVGTKAPNAWGLYDMSGNVSELTGDGFATYTTTDSVTDPQVPITFRQQQVIRGGSVRFIADAARVDRRMQAVSSRFVGFRVVLPE